LELEKQSHYSQYIIFLEGRRREKILDNSKLIGYLEEAQANQQYSENKKLVQLRFKLQLAISYNFRHFM
jgi:hypothetical protein